MFTLLIRLTSWAGSGRITISWLHYKPSSSLPRSLLRKSNLEQADQSPPNLWLEHSWHGSVCQDHLQTDSIDADRTSMASSYWNSLTTLFLMYLKWFFQWNEMNASDWDLFFPYYVAVEEKIFRGKKSKHPHTHIHMTHASSCTHTLHFQSQTSSLQYCKYQDGGVTMNR